LGEATRYAMVAMVMAILNYSVYLVLINMAMEPIMSVTLATALQTVISFYTYRRIVFKN
jgi:putative flippase GtrA